VIGDIAPNNLSSSSKHVIEVVELYVPFFLKVGLKIRIEKIDKECLI